MVSSYVDYLVRWNRIPPMIVTGARNVDRNRDFLWAEDSNFPGSGGADAFTRFVESEWATQIANRFKAQGPRILAGHSFGGSYTLYSLTNSPGFFDAYIAIGSSTWVSGRAIFDEADSFLQSPLDKNLFLYMAVAEADGGATVPDGVAFAEKLQSQPLAGLETHFEIIDETNHFTAVTPALVSALDKLYPAWGLDTEVREVMSNEGVEGLNQWFSKKEQTLGYRFFPPKMELENLAISMAQEGQGPQAEALVENLLNRYPESYTTLFAQGFVYVRQGKLAEAVAPFEAAARYAGEAGETPTLVARYQRAAETIKARMAEAG